MEVALTPPALNRDRFVTVDAVSDDGDTARVLFSCSSSIDDAEALQGCFILAHDEDIELDELTAAYEDLIDREVIDRIAVRSAVSSRLWRPGSTMSGLSTGGLTARS